MRISLISIVGGESFYDISKLREKLCNISHSYASLQFPPHITLVQMKVPESEKNSLYYFFEETLDKFSPFIIRTEGIVPHTYTEKGKKKYTVRFNIEENLSLTALRTAMVSTPLGEKRESRDPHITLAFGDLTKDNFNRLQNYLADPANSDIQRYFAYTFNNLSILERRKLDKKDEESFKNNKWRVSLYLPL